MPRYMTIGKLTITAGNRPAAEQIADQGVAAFEQQPGFERVEFYLDEDRSEYGNPEREAQPPWQVRDTRRKKADPQEHRSSIREPLQLLALHPLCASESNEHCDYRDDQANQEGRRADPTESVHDISENSP